MSHRPVLAAAIVVTALLTSACTDRTVEPTAPATTVAPVEAPAITAPPAPAPTVSSTPYASPALLVQWPYDTTFTYHGIGTIETGATYAELEESSGWRSNSNSCSSMAQLLYSPTIESSWLLLAIAAHPNKIYDDKNSMNLEIGSFLLSGGYPDSDITGKYGPVGPQGIRLGTAEADVKAMFPDATTFVTVNDWDQATYKNFIVSANGKPRMAIATSDGTVVMIAWGSPATAKGIYGRPCAN